MWKITRAGLRTQLVEYVKENKNNDDDNGTVWHRLSHLNTRYEPYNEQYITHGHRAYCCINCVLVFALFTIILLLAYRYPAFTTTTDQTKNENRQNLVSFQCFQPKIGP